ncbi:hypothetical protein PHO31112_04231 [Pandoraea horticolens]|uniref:Uncharacterized protein n=1 Tax=Pandoraea horticolens TaxID=2508298 RepID=A0A5E4Y2H0_9BURK|nr:hypothetical protein PHO31112_04231 [Pandoraea horticolens]
MMKIVCGSPGRSFVLAYEAKFQAARLPSVHAQSFPDGAGYGANA